MPWPGRFNGIEVSAGTIPQLFDLANDVGEQHDLATDQPAKVQALKTLWDTWNAEQAAPKGPAAKTAKKAAR